MIRVYSIALSFLMGVTSISAADWSDATFPIKSHDFGTVAVAAKTEFSFPIHNNSSKNLHIRSVRASCGCTTPIVENKSIGPNQTGSILARFNTDTFRGKRGATLTVIIDQPFYTEVRLRVDGYIRSDMVFNPGAIEFGQVEQGSGVSKSSKILYAGRDDWQVVDVQCNRPWLMPSFEEVTRSRGRVDYELAVAIQEDAPTGFFQDELIVMTNDRTMPKVPLRVSGQVESPLRMSPQAFALGSLKPGETATQKMILVGKEPFQVASIQADGWDITFAPTTEAKKLHVLYPEFTLTDTVAGPQKKTIVITTSGEQSVTASGLLTADIRAE
jgi:hypothetical protein